MKIILVVLLLGNAVMAARQSDDARSVVTREITRQRKDAAELRYAYRTPVRYDSGPRAGYAADIYRTVGFSGATGILVEVQHEDSLTRRDEWPEWARHTIVGDRWLLEWPCKRLYCVSPARGQQLPAVVWEDPFLACSGWWPLPAEHAAGSFCGLSFDLFTALTDSSTQLERIGSSIALTRHHAKSGVTERSELDGNAGWAVTRRTWTTSDGHVLLEASVSRHARVLAGVWLPAEFTLRVPGHVGADEPDAWRRNTTGHMVSCEAGPFRSLTLSVTPNAVPGLARYDETTGGIHQEIAGGEDYLAAEGSRLARVGASSQRSGFWKWCMLLVAGCVVAWQRRRIGSMNPDHDNGAAAAPNP